MPQDVAAFFRAWIQRNGAKGAVGEVASLLAEGRCDSSEFAAIVGAHSVAREQWFRDGMLDLVLEYARAQLAERMLTIDDLAEMQLLKRAVHIAEGELMERRPLEIASMIQAALEEILEDEQIDKSEELFLVGLQAVFDLSYDEFLTVGRTAFERVFMTLDMKAAIATREGDKAQSAEVVRKRSALEHLHWLATRQRRSLGAMY